MGCQLGNCKCTHDRTGHYHVVFEADSLSQAEKVIKLYDLYCNNSTAVYDKDLFRTQRELIGSKN